MPTNTRKWTPAIDKKLSRLKAACRRANRAGDLAQALAKALEARDVIISLGEDLPLPPGVEDLYFNEPDQVRAKGMGITLD